MYFLFLNKHFSLTYSNLESHYCDSTLYWVLLRCIGYIYLCCQGEHAIWSGLTAVETFFCNFTLCCFSPLVCILHLCQVKSDRPLFALTPVWDDWGPAELLPQKPISILGEKDTTTFTWHLSRRGMSSGCEGWGPSLSFPRQEWNPQKEKKKTSFWKCFCFFVFLW